MINDAAPQLTVIHVSDLHFGARHRFEPPQTPAGDVPKRDGFPSLVEKLCEDWAAPRVKCPVIVCITGDVTNTATESEFKAAAAFITGITKAKAFGCSISPRNIFVVPGNHDVIYAADDIDERMRPWTEFHNDIYATRLLKREHRQIVQLHDRFDDMRAYILSINSAMHVQKDKPDEDRGHIDVQQLKAIQDQLKAVPEDRLRRAIKVAILHHHPVLIPAMAEPGRGYDAVHNSGKLLSILRRYGFQLVLHGHKHNPHTFTDDTRSAFNTSRTPPLLIVAGGSAGSFDLPESPRKGNTYNRITIKWHPDAGQSRIEVQTRRLAIFEPDGTERLPQDWQWETIDEDDRSFYAARRLPPITTVRYRKYDEAIFADANKRRRHEYERLRGNMPVLEVLPALEAEQAYEARMWVVPHKNPIERPVSVTWTAGPKFPIVTIARGEDPNFCAAFSYWGPFVVQARLTFADGSTAEWHMYARMPAIYDGEGSEA